MLFRVHLVEVVTNFELIVFLSKNFVCTIIIPKSHRSVLCKFRCGVKIETGRYEGLPVDRRIYPFCSANNNINVIENECHVLFECNLYNDLRTDLFEKALTSALNFDDLNINDKFKFLFTDDSLIRILAKTCFLILQRRILFM